MQSPRPEKTKEIDHQDSMHHLTPGQEKVMQEILVHKRMLQEIMLTFKHQEFRCVYICSKCGEASVEETNEVPKMDWM